MKSLNTTRANCEEPTNHKYHFDWQLSSFLV